MAALLVLQTEIYLMKKQTVRSQRGDSIGDRMKTYERIETEQRFCPGNILHVRMDGKGFSKYTADLDRPFDIRLTRLMQETTAYLVKKFNALVGYTQSDEISLLIPHTYDSPMMFDGKKQKLVSSTAAMATAYFNVNSHRLLPEKFGKGDPPQFDSRIFVLPNESEAINSILWREFDATKNSISMLARHYFSHAEVQNHNGAVLKDMLKTKKNVIWEDQPNSFKYGSYIKRIQYYGNMLDLDEQVVRHKVDIVDNIILNDMTHEDRMNFILSKTWQ